MLPVSFQDFNNANIFLTIFFCGEEEVDLDIYVDNIHWTTDKKWFEVRNWYIPFYNLLPTGKLQNSPIATA